MKKAILILIMVVMFFATAPPVSAATFDADNGIPFKSPLISKGNQYHPDTTQVYDLNSGNLSEFPNYNDSKYSSINKPEWVNGPSGDDKDKAVYIKAKTNEAFEYDYTSSGDSGNQLFVVYDKDLMNTILTWTGKQIIEFDVKADNANGRLGVMMWYMWHDSKFRFLTEDGKIIGSDYSYPIGEWFHVKMVFENHIWNVYVEDSEGEHHVIKNIPAVGKSKPGNTWSEGSRIAFLFNQPNVVASEDERMGFSLDNMHFYRLFPVDGGDDISNYVTLSYEEENGSPSLELPDTGKLLVNFSALEDVSLLNKGNIVLEDSNGAEIEYIGEYENDIYKLILLTKLVPAAQYKLKISDEIRKTLNSDVPPGGSIMITVRDDRTLKFGNPLVQDLPEAGEKFDIAIPVVNQSGEQQYAGALICMYDEKGALVAINRTNLSVSKWETQVNLVLNVPEDYDDTFKVKVFLTEGDGIRILDEKNI